MGTTSTSRSSGAILILMGALMVAYYPALWVYGKMSQYALHRQWEARVGATSDHGVPSPIVGRLVIPRIWVDQIVLEGVGDDQLSKGPGHFPATAKPGEGNCVVAGHLNIDGSPFRDLNQLAPGDLVMFQTDEHLVEYHVTSSRTIHPSDTTVLKKGGPNRLVLVTCTPGAARRYLVICRQTKVQ